MRRLPVPALVCAAIAMANALAWAIITPPFQVPDENAHLAYAQHLAETGEPPRNTGAPGASTELFETQVAVHAFDVAARPENRPVWSQLQDEGVGALLARDFPRDDGGGFSNATNNPPLYYLLLLPSYAAGGATGGDLLDRLALMRLVSVALAGLCALFTFLFLRELLPRTPWAWTIGALAVAFQPLFGFMSGGVNNDAILAATAAALLFGLARAFRRGLTPRRAAGIGAAFGLGLTAKVTLLAFAPALVVAAIVLLRRQGRAALPAVAMAAGVAAVPVLVYVLVNGLVWDRPLWSGAAQFSAGTSEELGPSSSLREQLSYLWQFYLPRLPFMSDQFAGGYYPLWENSFQGFIGRFGWLDYGFPEWVYQLALAVVAVLLALAGRELWARRHVLRRQRAGELATYAAAVLGLVVVIAVAGYGARQQGQGFEQARYFLPLLPLYGATVALGARGAGRRFGPAAGAAIVVLVMGHALFAQLLTIARYYG